LHLKDYAAVIHLHSAYSFDGRAPITAILNAAKKGGIDVLMLTDHSTLRAREDGFEGWHDGILLVIGRQSHARKRNPISLRKPILTGCGPEEGQVSSPIRTTPEPHCFT